MSPVTPTRAALAAGKVLYAHAWRDADWDSLAPLSQDLWAKAFLAAQDAYVAQIEADAQAIRERRALEPPLVTPVVAAGLTLVEEDDDGA